MSDAKKRVADISSNVDEETFFSADAVFDVEGISAVLGAIENQVEILTAAGFEIQLSDNFIVILDDHMTR